MLELGMMQTLALAALAVAIGQGMRRWFPVLARYDLPEPVLGGLVVALLVSLLRLDGQPLVQFDTTLQTPLMVAFFTTIGFGASVRLLRVGGVQVMLFLVLATGAALAQNLLGAGLVPLREHAAPLVRRDVVGEVAGADLLAADDHRDLDLLAGHRGDPGLERRALGAVWGVFEDRLVDGGRDAEGGVGHAAVRMDRHGVGRRRPP